MFEKIVQADQVTTETMELLKKKGQVEVELHQKREELRGVYEAIDEAVAREKSFRDSFIGNAEWYKNIQDLRARYAEEKAVYESLVADRRALELRISEMSAALAASNISLGELQRRNAILNEQLEALKSEDEITQKKREAVESQLHDTRKELEVVQNELCQVKEKVDTRNREIDDREKELSQKELNLKVYEERIIREYAIVFPGVTPKP